MIENFGGSVVYLILFLIQLLGLAFYSYLILFTPKTVTSDYGFGESAVPVVRLIGSFIIPFVLIGIYLMFTSIEGSWVYFVHSYMIKTKETGLIVANADYGIKVPAVIQQKNFIGINDKSKTAKRTFHDCLAHRIGKSK